MNFNWKWFSFFFLIILHLLPTLFLFCWKKIGYEAKCDECNQIFARNSSNTTQLIRHLNNDHGIYRQLPAYMEQEPVFDIDV